MPKKNSKKDEDKIPNIEALLREDGSYEGIDAFNELCLLGCGKSTLGSLLIQAAGKPNILIQPKNQSKGKEISTLSLDSLETASKPFNAHDIRSLQSLARRTERLLNDIQLLKQSALIKELKDRSLISGSHLLGGLPIIPHHPFEGLLNLPELANRVVSKKRPDHNRLLTRIQKYIYNSTNKKWHDALLATVLNHLPYYSKKKMTVAALKQRRYRRNFTKSEK